MNSPKVKQCIIDFNTNQKYCGTTAGDSGSGGGDGGNTPPEYEVLPFELNKVGVVFNPTKSPDSQSRFAFAVDVFQDTMVTSTPYASISEDTKASTEVTGHRFASIYEFVEPNWSIIQNVVSPWPGDFGSFFAKSGDDTVFAVSYDTVNSETKILVYQPN